MYPDVGIAPNFRRRFRQGTPQVQRRSSFPLPLAATPGIQVRWTVRVGRPTASRLSVPTVIWMDPPVYI